MKVFAVISHTHWDREWYKSLEGMRVKLVDLMDRCLETLKKYPEYIFHLDAQTIVLEDYLEIRPGKREEIRQRVQEGRLLIGPWYVQNDFYLTSGESTVRNLLTGIHLAQDFGDSTMVAYAPDQFGNISQLPQIFQQFGMDTFIFGRGLAKMVKKEDGTRERVRMAPEFIWEGADGSKMLAIHMTFWYNNAQRFSEDIDKAVRLAELCEEQFEGWAVTPYLLLMNGVDHLEAQDNLLPILEQVQKRLPEGKVIKQYRMDDYCRDVKKYIEDNKISLETRSGELRMGGDYEVLQGTLSSRVYLKQANTEAQNALECRIEPLYAMAEQMGFAGSYPSDYLKYFWKKLIQNHPHDSICGCSCDAVHAHMEDNYSRLKDYTDNIFSRGMQLFTRHMALKDATKNDYILTVFNTTEAAQAGLVQTKVMFPQADGVGNFELFDDEGNRVDYLVLAKRPALLNVFTPINLPGNIDVDEYTILFYAGEVPPMSVRAFLVRPAAGEAAMLPACDGEMEDAVELSAGELTLKVHKDGRVDATYANDGRVVEDCLLLEDTADVGNAYTYHPVAEPAILSDAMVRRAEVVEWNDLRKSVCIHNEMRLPAEFDIPADRRSDRTETFDVAITITAERGSDHFGLSYAFTNRSMDHRLRLLIKTGLRSDHSYADIPYDVICNGPDQNYPDTMSPVHPSTSFACVSQEGKGVVVYTKGNMEYELLPDGETLAYTLVRSTGIIDGAKMRRTDTWTCPENQCLRPLSGEFGLASFNGCLIEANLPLKAKLMRNPLVADYGSVDITKLSGGRSAVQDTSLAEVFYLPDPYEAVRVESGQSALKVEGDGVTVTAFKKLEDESGLLVRVCNYSSKAREARLAIRGTIYNSRMDETVGEKLGENELNFCMKPKEIRSFIIR